MKFELPNKNYLNSKIVKEENLINKALTITGVQQEEMPDRTLKCVLYFKNETDKGLILNRTNGETMLKNYGEETDKWHGKIITIDVIPSTYSNFKSGVERETESMVIKPKGEQKKLK